MEKEEKKKLLEKANNTKNECLKESIKDKLETLKDKKPVEK